MLQELVKRSIPLAPGSTLLILGGGFSGQHIGALARALGTSVICSRRNIESLGADIVFDSTTKQTPNPLSLKKVTHLLSCIPPTPEGEDPVLTCLGEQLKELPIQWAGYLSTTGVYGDSNGNWVTEADLPRPLQARSKRRLKWEKAWEASGLPIQILRLPGIYGPGRSACHSIRSGKSKMIDKPGQVFSRIHVDDIAGAIIHLINLSTKGIRPSVINVTDNLPTTNLEVLRFAADLLGYSLPPIEPFEIASQKMSPMALSFWQENRRVNNELLCNELGYHLIHPDFRFGMKDCFKVLKMN